MNSSKSFNSAISAVETVNHPLHYMSEKGIEAIDVMEAFTEGMDGVEATNTSNILKYILRWKKKNGIEDLKKARWYLNRLIEKLEQRRIDTVEENATMSSSTIYAHLDNGN